MKLGNRIIASVGQALRKLVFLVGIVTILVMLLGTYTVAQPPVQTALIEALNNIADAIRTVAIQGPEGAQGPPGEPGPIAEIYVNSMPAPEVVGGFGGATVLCDEGDVATGGGVSCPLSGACGSGSNGPFISYAGPLLDESGRPIGWEFAMDFISISPSPLARELFVVCSQVSTL